MFGLYHVYAIPKTWIQQLRAQHIQKQQWGDAGETELRSFARSSSGFAQDTSYRPHSMCAEKASSTPAGTTHKIPSSITRYTTGWRFGAINGAFSSSIVFFINLIVTILFSSHKNGVLFDGDCDRASKLNTGLHLLINILSTVLLSSSNYCMQCLSAPTRKEVDDAHSKGKWLDIGVQSVHNLRNIYNTDRKRAVVWFLLGFSSLPLHLFYNSTVFLSISSNDYFAVSVRESFISSPDCADCAESFLGGEATDFYFSNYNLSVVAPMMYEKARDNKLDRLSNIDCIGEYAKSIQTNRRNVLLVTADNRMPTPNTTAKGTPINIYSYNIFYAGQAKEVETAISSYEWICSGYPRSYGSNPLPCSASVDGIKSASDKWTVSGVAYHKDFGSLAYPVDYCLSEKSEPRCKVQFALPIAILVTILNFFKAVLIFYTALGTKENPLMTMGDAVASFLERTDETTKGMCLLSVRDVKTHNQYFPAGPKAWAGERRRLKDVASRKRRSVTFVFLSLTLVFVAVMFGYGVYQLPNGTSRSLTGLASLGYGTIDVRTIMSYPTSLTTIGYIILANLAQPVLSFLYFSYNGLFTAMLLGYEWVSYAHHRKGLRVSRPAEGAQRSTYFLQLPYRFALPLMVLSGVLHWLVSQSIFLVAVDVYSYDGTHSGLNAYQGDFKSTGYSPIAILTTLILGIVMTAAAIGIGFIPFKEGMNVAGSCSAAMSAACHGLDDVDGFEAARSKVQWGVVDVNEDGIGHCAFSTKEVKLPKVGHMYAGRITARACS
ncbi:hypothetical protein P171DRAFT_525453 [Karstenula rhodostoma CBS 690.94]|uniref:DUF6536 domain-containing protein n=1 Tax=Karstenula rhodostoma CBS 690.94 TaxID=1392251 RepID=A0A9P4U826_9PLEO|nr:hypothetical protein P171DRAFT_525453 [Karstenula rhodostoma CBS 690.94]